MDAEELSLFRVSGSLHPSPELNFKQESQNFIVSTIIISDERVEKMSVGVKEQNVP